jgi:hypothetical protein
MIQLQAVQPLSLVERWSALDHLEAIEPVKRSQPEVLPSKQIKGR